MSAEDLEKYETEMELQLYREYRDIVRQFSYVVETERRFYLANQVDLHVRNSDGEVYFEVEMHDAWVWDMYRPARFVKNVRVMTFKDVNVEELEKPDISLPVISCRVIGCPLLEEAQVVDGVGGQQHHVEVDRGHREQRVPGEAAVVLVEPGDPGPQPVAHRVL